MNQVYVQPIKCKKWKNSLSLNKCSFRVKIRLRQLHVTYTLYKLWHIVIYFHTCQCFYSLSVDGFFFLLIGTALYNELVHVECIPCLRKPLRDVDFMVSPSTPPRGNIQSAEFSDSDEINTSEKTPLLQDWTRHAGI